jgi:molecular chaperone DnaJ
MNTLEACSLLGVSTGASMDEVKKAFKKKAAELHPDRNQSPDAEDKFKKVNEAYQILEKYGTQTHNPFDVGSAFYKHEEDLAAELRRQMNEMFGVNFRQNFNNVRFASKPIIIPVDVPFSTAVLGGKKEITYEHTVKCERCRLGKISTNKKLCQKCGGKKYRKYGNDDKELPCSSCKATGYTSTEEKCPDCGASGVHQKVSTLNVTIPSGAESGLRLVLKGKGNYRPDTKTYDNVVAVLNVLPDHDMQLSGNDVIGVVELTLLEALKGTKKRLRTVKGEKTLAFKPNTRHRDTVRVSGFGVPPHGAHVFVVNVSYPEDTSKLIEALENTDEPEPDEISGVQS